MIYFLLIMVIVLQIWIISLMHTINNNICAFAEIVKQLKREIKNR